MAFTRELKKDEGYPDLSHAKSSNQLQSFGDIIGEEANEFSIRKTHNPPSTQGFGSPSKVQGFTSANKKAPVMENDDQWGDFNLFAQEKKKKPQGRFADKFASKLKKQKQFFKTDAPKIDPIKQKKQNKLAEKMTNTMNRGRKVKNVDNEIVGQRNITKNIDLEIEAEDAKFEDRYECQGCGRNFKRETLERHKKVCKKVFQTKRKEFKTEEQRQVAKEQKMLAKKGQRKMNTQKNLATKKGKNWKKKSEGLKNFLKKKKGKKIAKEPEIEILVK